MSRPRVLRCVCSGHTSADLESAAQDVPSVPRQCVLSTTPLAGSARRNYLPHALKKLSRIDPWCSSAIAVGFAGTVDHAKKGAEAVGSREITTRRKATCGRPKRPRPRHGRVIK